MERLRTECSTRLDPDTRWKNSITEEAGKLEEFWSKLPAPWDAYGRLRLGVPGDPQEIVREAFGDSLVHIVALFPTEFGTYRWRLAQDGGILEWKRSDMTLPDVQGFAAQFVKSLANDQDVEGAGRFFFELFDGIPAGETICIVPSGPLLQVPFGALPADGGYLIERNPVAVLPGLSLLPYWAGKSSNETVLVLGDSLGDLEGARNEAEAVAARLKTNALVGESVTRSTVGPAMQSCGVLHAAVHAFYNERDPQESGFWLADRTVFSARDLSEGHVRLRLAVLSACESGVLDVAAADELTGIAASLLLNGVASVVASLWGGPDKSTLGLMTRFYESASAGAGDLAKALAEAQRALIQDAQTHRPHHWAAFQLVGDWRAGIRVSRPLRTRKSA